MINSMHKYSKQVIDNSNGKIYTSAVEAAAAVDVNYNTLVLKLSGHRKNRTSLKYVNDELDYNKGLTLADVERGFIIDMYNFYGGNMTLVAKKIAVSRTTLYRKVKAYRAEGYI